MRNSPYPPGSGWDKIRAARLEKTKEARAKQAQIQKDIRQWCKENGICSYCRKEKATEGIYCHDCREKNNARRRHPKEVKPTKKKPLTDEQKAKKRQYAKEKRLSNIENGLCSQCGKNAPLPGRKLCNNCRLYLNQFRYGYVEHTAQWYEKERREKRI